MKRLLVFTLAIAALSSPAQGEDIGTIERGNYVCELPGDATGPAGIAQPQADFVIDSASRYSSAQGTGTYLRRGDLVTFTSGPRNGEAYRIIGHNFLRKLEADGTPGRLRCIRQPG